MRTFLTILALWGVVATAAAQPYTPSYGLEAPRSIIRPAATAEEASAAVSFGTMTEGRYFTPVAFDMQIDRTFTTYVTVPFAWTNRLVLLHIESASAPYEVRLNGQAVARNANPNAAAEVNLTRVAKEGRNTLEIVLDAKPDTAPLEGWHAAESPSVGRVWLMSQPVMRVRDVLAKAWRADLTDTLFNAEVAVVIKSEALNSRTVRLYYELLTPEGERATSGYQDLTLEMRGEDTLRFLATVPARYEWNVNKPNLYTLRLKTQRTGRFEEYIELQQGFRTLFMAGRQLLVNSAATPLRVCDVEPTATPAELAALRRAGHNTLRLRPGRLSEAFLEVCDTMGLYVIAQAPIDTRESGHSRRKGGNISNDPAWTPAFIERAEATYHTTKRHPSVLIYSLARNSENGICLYEAYLRWKRYDEIRPLIYPEAAGEWNSDLLTLEQ